jgi:hypothetical protein
MESGSGDSAPVHLVHSSIRGRNGKEWPISSIEIERDPGFPGATLISDKIRQGLRGILFCSKGIWNCQF